MAEDFLPEGFELAQEDKQKEIIPGFEVVEKTEVVAAGAAPAAAGNQAARNTDSTSEDVLSAYSVENLTTETEPEETEKDKKKPKSQYRVVNIDGELKIFNKGGKNDLVRIEDSTISPTNDFVYTKGKAKVVESIQVDEYLRNLNINFGDDDEGIVRYEKIELPNKGFNDIKDKAYDTEEKVTINIPGEDPLSKVVTENRDWYIPISIDPNTGEEIAGEPVMVNKNRKEVMLRKLMEAHNKSKLSSEREIIHKKLDEVRETWQLMPDIGAAGPLIYKVDENDPESMLDIIIPDFEIVADDVIQADVNYYTDRIAAAQALVKEKNKLLTNPDLLPEERKKIQDELKDADADLIHQYKLQQDAANRFNIYQDNNPNIAFNEEDKRGPDANKIISNVNISYKLDENGDQIPILDSDGKPTGEFEIEKFKVADLDKAKQISQQDARTVTERINNNFLNYNIGADKDGDIVTVYKAPVMNDKGSIDIIATAKANGMPDSVIDQARRHYKTRNIFFNVQEEAAEKWMKENGFSKSAEFGYNKTLNLDADEEQLKSLEGFINFVQNEKGEYAVNENVSEFQTNHIDEVLVKRQQQNIKKQQKLANTIQADVDKNNQLIDDYKSEAKYVADQVSMMDDNFTSTKEHLARVNSEQAGINAEAQDLVDQLKKDIASDPSNEKSLLKQYEKERKDLERYYQENEEEKKRIIKNYEGDSKQLFKSYNKAVEDLNKVDVEMNTLSLSLRNNMDDLNVLASINQQADYINDRKLKMNRIVYDNAEGEGTYLHAISKSFTDMFVEVQGGKAQAFADLASAINYLEYGVNKAIKGKDFADTKFDWYESKINADRIAFEYDIKSAQEIFTPKGMDEAFYRQFSQSTIGGTIQSLTQMAAATFSAPVTGLFGGFFFSSLAENKAKIRGMKNDYISQLRENNPGMSRSAAKAKFEENFSPAKQQMYSYTQAAVTGVLNYVSGKILKGGGKYSQAVINKITNSVLGKMTGNVTARDIQVAVYKYLGKRTSNVLTKGARMGLVGVEELTEEIAEAGAGAGIDAAFESMTGLNFENFRDMDSETFWKEFSHMAKVSFLSGMLGGSINVVMDQKKLLTQPEENLSREELKKLDKFYETIADNAASVDAMRQEIAKKKEEFNLGYISEEEFKQYELEVQENYNIYSNIDNGLNGRTIIDIATLTKRKNALEAKLEGKDKKANGRIVDEIDSIDAQIKALSSDSNNFRQKGAEDVVAEQLQKVIDIKKERGEIEEDFKGEIVTFNADNVQEIAEKYNVPVESLIDPDTGDFSAEGSYLSDQGVILMSDQAAEGVLEHEGLHNYLNIALNKEENKDVVFSLANSLMEKMEKINPEAAEAIKTQLQKYEDDPNYTAQQVAEETLTYYAQLKKAGVFDQDKSYARKFMDYIQKLLRSAGFGSVEVNEGNIDKIIDDYVSNVSRGKTSRAQEKVIKGDVKIDDKTKIKGKEIAQEVVKEETPVINIDKDKTIKSEINQAASKVVQSKPIKVDVKSMSNSFDQNLSQDLRTNDDFKNSDAAIDAYTAIESNPQFNSYINQLINRDNNLQGLDSDVRQEVNRKIKENLQLRALNNFKPVVDGNRRSLFSYLYGKADQRGLGGIAQKALLDVKKEYATRADAGAVSTDVTDSEGRSFDIADTSTDIIEDVDRGVAEAPRSTFRRNIVRGNEKGLTPQEVKDFKKIAEPLLSKLPDVNAKNYRTKVNQVAGPALKKWVKENIIKGQDYKTFINDNYNNIRDLGIDYLIDLDKGLQKQGKPRMFTEFNKKLTTQAEIRKYRDSGRAFVENEAQGVSLFDIKNPGPEAMVKFFTDSTPSNNSNRKGKLMEAFGKKMFKDFMPESRANKGDTDQVKATSARKTGVKPNVLFSKTFDGKAISKLKEIAGLRSKNQVAKELGFDGSAINEKGRPKFLQQMQDAAANGQIDVATIESALMMSGGKETFYGTVDGKKYKSYGDAAKNGINMPLKFAKRDNGDYVVIAKPTKVKNKKMPLYSSDKSIDREVAKYSDYVPKTGRLYWGAKDPKYKELIETADKSPFNSKYKRIDPMRKGRGSVKSILNSEKDQQELNMDMLDHVVNQLANSVNNKQNPLSMDVAGLIVIQSYQATSGLIKSAAPFKYISDVFESGSKKETRSKKDYREEHNPPASVVGASILYAIKNNQAKAVMKDIKKNFYQTILSKKDDSLLDIKYAATLPKGTYIGTNPIIRMAMSGINLNTIKNIETNQSIADEFGLGVAETVQSFPNVFNLQNKLIEEVVKGETKLSDAKKRLAVYTEFPNNGEPSLAKTQNDATVDTKNTLQQSKVLNVDENMDVETLLSKAASIDAALANANKLDAPVKKIRVFDFDDTLATSKNLVFYTAPDGKTGQLNAEEFATDGKRLMDEGYIMDFSDFNKVTDGGRGPLFDVAKKIKEARGNEDLYVLTARAPEARDAIYEFLKAEGLEFKRNNIVGLGNSTGEAKANWIIDKAADGYNDFYFADDAYQNVKAVQDALNVIDVKSKVQQAKIQQSKKLDIQFNKLLEETTGVDFYKEYSAAKAKTRGANKGRFKFFIPHSAEDFLGLIYPTLGKGSIGDSQMAWYKTHLLDPYTKAQENLSAARLNLMNDFKQLKKSLNVPKDLRKKNSTGMTNEQAVRVYLFQSMDYDIPGLSKTDLKEMQSVVENDPKLREFAEQILTITKGDGYSKPKETWLTGTITTDLIDLINTEKRSKYLAKWQENVDAIYSKENLNKLEALYGTKYREALEGVLRRMKSGRNRLDTGNRLSNKILDYINGSVGTIMFFNTRSAVLQTISAVNFLNWNFNNPLMAGKAFANQPQYWKDFVKLINSDYLKDRRNGLKLNISESEIADAASTSKNKAKAALNYILQKGYLPTQYADSFAIASGGATFYRNRVNDLIKNDNKTQEEAEAQALVEWRQVSETSQQSSDPSKISSQQSSDLGRIILAFANTPMQYARIQKRAIQDLANGRGDAKTHVSKIIYYGVIQNVIFNALQQAVYAIGFGDDDEEEKEEFKQKKYLNTANGMLDSMLRGLGIGGAAVSVGKNFLLDIYERSGRKRPEYVDAVWKLTQFSPPINSKISKLKQAAWHFDSKKRRQVIFDKGFALDNPAYEAFAKVVSATTNVPIDRLFYKMKNIEGALNEENDLWQRIAMLAGWPKWQLEPKKESASVEVTPEQKEKDKAAKAVQAYKAAKGSTNYDTIKKLTSAQQIKMLKGLGYGDYTIKNAKSEKSKIDLIIYKNKGGKIKVDKKAVDTAKYKALSKADQVRKLDSLGLSKADIAALKYEKDRVAKLLELMK